MSRFKVVLIGAAGIGKSNLANRFTKNDFVPRMPADIAGQYYSKILERSDTPITLDLWTTPGNRPNIGGLYYKEAHVIGLTFDLTSDHALAKLSQTYSTLDKIKESAAPNAQFILLGTKGDLTASIKVSQEEIANFQTTHNIQHYVQTSAKTGEGIATLGEIIETCTLTLIPQKKPEKKSRISSLFSSTSTMTPSATSQSSPPALMATASSISTQSQPPTSIAPTQTEPATSQLDTTVAIASPAPTQPKHQSLLIHKDRFIHELSQYKLNREKRGAGVFGFSKQDKMNAATKAMACFYGADQIGFSKRDRDALKTGQLRQSILEALPENGRDIQLINSLQKTREAAISENKDAYKKALIQFLSDYKAMRELHGKGSFFGLSGFDKNTKISAVEKLISHLKGEFTDSFSHAEIGALEEAGGRLKKVIATTLSWFSNAPTFENFMKTYTTPSMSATQNNAL